MGKPNRWLFLRHPEGFDDQMLETFRASCKVWQAKIEAILEGWDHLSPYHKMLKPSYEFFPIEVDDEGKIVRLPLGGNLSYGAAKTFEDAFPSELFEFFPMWFQLDLDWGMQGAPRPLKTIRWAPVQPAWDRNKLRNQHFFRRPSDDSE